jgi:hypothetical protein
VAIARRADRRRPTFGLALAALALVVVEAAMAQGRVASGALRYELPAVAVGSVVAGCAWVDATRFVAARRPATPRRRWGGAIVASATVLIAASIPGLVGLAGSEGSNWPNDTNLARLADRLPAAIAKAGGRGHLVACGPIDTANLEIPLLTWALHLRLGEVGYTPPGQGTIFVVGPDGPPVPARYRSLYTSLGPTSESASQWGVLTTCRPAVS